MIPYLHPEFVEALKLLATERSAKGTPADVSRRRLARKKKDHFTSLWRSTAHLRSRIVPVVTKFILLLIYECL
jgi:hypothetical protein